MGAASGCTAMLHSRYRPLFPKEGYAVKALLPAPCRAEKLWVWPLTMALLPPFLSSQCLRSLRLASDLKVLSVLL